MKRQICWIERRDDGVKRETRVTFLSGQRIKWQFKRADVEFWDYTSLPTDADWEGLETRTENRYRRRTATIADLDLVRQRRIAARRSAASGETVNSET